MVSLAILDYNKEELLSIRDDSEAMTVLTGYLEKITNKDSTVPTMPSRDGTGDSVKESKNVSKLGIFHSFEVIV